VNLRRWTCYLFSLQRGASDAGGTGRNRTADQGFADPCLTTWLPCPILSSTNRGARSSTSNIRIVFRIQMAMQSPSGHTQPLSFTPGNEGLEEPVIDLHNDVSRNGCEQDGVDSPCDGLSDCGHVCRSISYQPYHTTRLSCKLPPVRCYYV
jgi:hypothetical protein